MRLIQILKLNFVRPIHLLLIALVIFFLVNKFVNNSWNILRLVNLDKKSMQLRKISMSKTLYVDSDAFMVKSNQGPDLTRLPNLNNISWPKREYASSSKLDNIYNYPPFSAQITKQQFDCFHDLLNIFTGIMLKMGQNNRWFIHSGTLLGSIRHHEIIPWDDDFDIMVPEDLRNEFRNEVLQISDLFGVQWTNAWDRDKFHFKTTNYTIVDAECRQAVTNFDWYWPYLDLCYYSTNESHVHELGYSYGSYYDFPLSDVFPLIYRPLGRLWVPTPFKSISYLTTIFKKNVQCSSISYSHLKEKGKAEKRLPCIDLAERYAVVLRCEIFPPNAVNNSLIIASEKLITFSKSEDIMIIHEITLASFPEDMTFTLTCYNK